MGIDQGHQLVFKAVNVVSHELISMLSHISKSNLSSQINKRIDCDISNIIHQLSFRHSRVFSIALVQDVASFLKWLASESGFIVTAILDGDVRPQSKRDAFKRRFESTMNRINSYYCRQSAMKITAKRIASLTNDERKS